MKFSSRQAIEERIKILMGEYKIIIDTSKVELIQINFDKINSQNRPPRANKKIAHERKIFQAIKELIHDNEREPQISWQLRKFFFDNDTRNETPGSTIKEKISYDIFYWVLRKNIYDWKNLVGLYVVSRTHEIIDLFRKTRNELDTVELNTIADPKDNLEKTEASLARALTQEPLVNLVKKLFKQFDTVERRVILILHCLLDSNYGKAAQDFFKIMPEKDAKRVAQHCNDRWRSIEINDLNDQIDFEDFVAGMRDILGNLFMQKYREFGGVEFITANEINSDLIWKVAKSIDEVLNELK